MDPLPEGARPIVIAGDLHGDLQWARHLIRSAHTAGARTILQVGDLGVLWPGARKGRFDAKLDRYLGHFDVDLVFIDGNHDNHAELRALKVDPDGLATVLPRIRYLPRAGRTVIQGLTTGGLGGAFSVDHRFRRAGVDWWPGIEEIEGQDLQKLVSGGPLGILLAHEVPAAVELAGEWVLPPEDSAAAQKSRHLLQHAVEALRPVNVFSGHWHQRITDVIPHSDGTQTRVDVLDMNGSREGNAVLVWPGEPLRIEPLVVGGGRR